MPKPLLILLDLNMPLMNGIQFLEQLRSDESLKDSIVFVLTTSNDERDKMAAYEYNVAGYLVKSRVAVLIIRVLLLREISSSRIH